MSIEIARTARGVIRPSTPEEIAREEIKKYLANDSGFRLVTDSGLSLVMNLPKFGFTNPDLHRRIDNDPEIPVGSNYSFVKYDENGVPYKQHVVIGVWDGLHSYRTTKTFIHDEESTTCEIP